MVADREERELDQQSDGRVSLQRQVFLKIVIQGTPLHIPSHREGDGSVFEGGLVSLHFLTVRWPLGLSSTPSKLSSVVTRKLADDFFSNSTRIPKFMTYLCTPNLN